MRLEFGFDADWYDGTGGNNALWQDVHDGLKLQPCTPTMVDSRDAILLADEVGPTLQFTSDCVVIHL